MYARSHAESAGRTAPRGPRRVLHARSSASAGRPSQSRQECRDGVGVSSLADELASLFDDDVVAELQPAGRRNDRVRADARPSPKAGDLDSVMARDGPKDFVIPG